MLYNNTRPVQQHNQCELTETFISLKNINIPYLFPIDNEHKFVEHHNGNNPKAKN